MGGPPFHYGGHDVRDSAGKALRWHAAAACPRRCAQCSAGKAPWPCSREVRSALVYVFRNLAKHGTRLIGQDIVDVMSSALRFDGWTAPLTFHVDDGLHWPNAPPRTWLLERGWIERGGGRIDPREVRRSD